MREKISVLLCEREGSGNLYVKLLADEYKRAGLQVVYDSHNFLYSNFEPTFVHIQWPESIYLNKGISLNKIDVLNRIKDRLIWYREKEIPIVHTVHNLTPHDVCDDFDKKVFGLILQFSDIIVHHGKMSINLIKSAYPSCASNRHIVCPHGPYPTVHCGHEDARSRLKIPLNKFVVLNFGTQRINKGSDFIWKVFKKVKLENSYLLTVGKKRPARIPESFLAKALLWLNIQREIKVAQIDSFFAKNRNNICRSVNEQEIGQVFSASNIVFLGHQSGINSGVIALAASYKKPVVYPDIGNFKEQLTGWRWQESYKFGDIDSAISAIVKMHNDLTVCGDSKNLDNAEWLVHNSWEKHILTILENLPNGKHLNSVKTENPF